jgi:hypothetical protein
MTRSEAEVEAAACFEVGNKAAAAAAPTEGGGSTDGK